MAFNEKYLGQLSPTGANPNHFYSGSSNGAVIKTLIVCNITSSPQLYDIFYNTSATHTAINALHYHGPIFTGETIHIDTFIVMETGKFLGVLSPGSTGQSIVITAFGANL